MHVFIYIYIYIYAYIYMINWKILKPPPREWITRSIKDASKRLPCVNREYPLWHSKYN